MTVFSLDAVEARLRAVLFEGRGRDGSLGSSAQRVALVADTFRPTLASLRDATCPPEAFSRGANLAWDADEDAIPPHASNYDRVSRSYGLTLEVGYHGASAMGTLAHKKASGENATTLVEYSTRTALADVASIRNALGSYELVGTDTEPPIEDVQVGRTRRDPLPSGAFVLVVPILVRVFASTDNTP